MGVWVNGCMCAWVYECMGVLMCGCMGVSVCISVQVRDIQRLMRAHELQSLSPETKRAAIRKYVIVFLFIFFCLTLLRCGFAVQQRISKRISIYM